MVLTPLHHVSDHFYLPPCVAEDNALADIESLVKIGKNINLPVLTLDVDVELLDTFESQLLALNQNADRRAHELLRHGNSFRRHSGAEKADLHILRKSLEDIVDLILETTRKHLISLIDHNNTEVVGAEEVALNHIAHTTRSTDDDLHSTIEVSNGFAHSSATDADC